MASRRLDASGDPVSHWHNPDPVALVAGVVSVLAALLFLLADLTPLAVNPGVVAALLLTGAGLGGLAVGRRRLH